MHPLCLRNIQETKGFCLAAIVEVLIHTDTYTHTKTCGNTHTHVRFVTIKEIQYLKNYN